MGFLSVDQARKKGDRFTFLIEPMDTEERMPGPDVGELTDRRFFKMRLLNCKKMAECLV